MIVAPQYNFFLRPSRAGRCFTLCLIVLVLILSWSLQMQIWTKLVCTVSALFVLARESMHWHSATESATERVLTYHPVTQTWCLIDRHGSRTLVACSKQFVLRRLVILQFKAPLGLVQRIYIPSDSVTAEEHHQLRRLVLSIFTGRA